MLFCCTWVFSGSFVAVILKLTVVIPLRSTALELQSLMQQISDRMVVLITLRNVELMHPTLILSFNTNLQFTLIKCSS